MRSGKAQVLDETPEAGDLTCFGNLFVRPYLVITVGPSYNKEAGLLDVMLLCDDGSTRLISAYTKESLPLDVDPLKIISHYALSREE